MKSGFIVLKRAFQVYQQIAENNGNIITFTDFAFLTSSLKVTCMQSCAGDCDLKISLPQLALLVVNTLFKIFVRGDPCYPFTSALQTN